MEYFVNQFNQIEPISLRDLRLLEGDELTCALAKIESIRLSSYMDLDSGNMKFLKNLMKVELHHLTDNELIRFLCHVKEVTLYWRSNDCVNWGISSLVLQDCTINNAVIEKICQLFSEDIFVNLKKLRVENLHKDKEHELGIKGWCKLCGAIQNSSHCSLTDLSLLNNRIGEKGCNELVKLIYNNKLNDIKTLNLKGNKIGNLGFDKLIRAFHTSNSQAQLEELNIDNNDIGRKGVKMAYAILRECQFPNLRILRVGNNPMNKSCMTLLCDVLSMHVLASLKCFDCTGIKLGKDGIIALVKLLRNECLPSLENLQLGDCGLSEKELYHLSYCIQDGYCKKLVELNLSSNKMKRKGVAAIQRMLCKESLPNLRVLNLSDNQLGNNGVEELSCVSSLNCMTQIQTLYLSHNHITDEGASVIYLFIRNKQWKSLEQLYLDENEFSKITVIHLHSLVEMNSKLQSIFINEIVLHRDPLIQKTRSISKEGQVDDSDENELLLKEIFNTSTDMIIPPCFLKRNDQNGEHWEPVSSKITPRSDSVGLMMDNTPPA